MGGKPFVKSERKQCHVGLKFNFVYSDPYVDK